jgi:Amidohydrolase
VRIIDADGHVAEGTSLALEAMQRWPQHIAPRSDTPGLVIEGRNYPESSDPGAGCPTQHGLSTAAGLNCRSAEGVLGDDFIMFASDYPHWDGEWPESTKHLRSRPDISEETRAKIGAGNAQRFYGLS